MTNSGPAVLDTAFAHLMPATDTEPGTIAIICPDRGGLGSVAWPASVQARVINRLGWYFTGADNVARIGNVTIVPVARYF